MRRKVGIPCVFAAAMAFVEAAVVIYLRALIGGGPLFPMKNLPPVLVTVIATYILEWKKIGNGKGIPSGFSISPFLLGVFLLALSGWITCRNARSVRR